MSTSMTMFTRRSGTPAVRVDHHANCPAGPFVAVTIDDNEGGEIKLFVEDARQILQIGHELIEQADAIVRRIHQIEDRKPLQLTAAPF